MTRLILLFLLLNTVACQAWPELPPELDVKWSGRSVYDGGSVYILATSSAAADDIRDRLEVVIGEITDIEDLHVKKGLVIAIDAEDPLLIEDPMRLLTALSGWHQAAIGDDVKIPAKTFIGKEAEVDPAVVARVIPAAIPMDGDSLYLPEVLREQARWRVACWLGGMCTGMKDRRMQREESPDCALVRWW